ncbi:MAG TPA: DHA2 family efflux MFS transporter permease subunit [Rhizomicrobium sp.]|nr:DHA2 family efflux MFS transporter permease subunit [Rhizomicrobium sp.]
MSDQAISAAEPVRDDPFELRIAIVCVMLGMFMQMLDSTIANVALPYMQGSLQASRDQITWVLTSYIIASAIMTAPVGWLASRFGRKELFLASLIGFTVASMACGAAQSIEQMVMFRLLQGAFGATLSPLSQAIILDRYPLEKRASIMAIWSMVIMLGPILGPTLGGFLTDNFSWRWVFYVNVPIGIVSVLGIMTFLREDRLPAPAKFDWFGFAALSAGIGGLQLMLDRGQSQAWFNSPEVVLEGIVALLGLYLFVVHLMTSKTSFVPPELLKDRNYRASLILTFFVGMVLLATSALLPPYLQTLGGYSVLDTGLLMAPRGLGTMLTMLIVGRLAMRLDPRRIMLVGSLTLAWSMLEMSTWTPQIDMATLSWTSFIQGAGMGMIFVPSNLYGFSTLPQHLRTDGASAMNLLRNVGSAAGVSLTTTLLGVAVQTTYAQTSGHASVFNRVLGVNADAMMLNPQMPFGLAALHGMIMRNATITAYADTFLFMFWCSLPVVLIVLTLHKVVLMPPQPGQSVTIEE